MGILFDEYGDLKPKAVGCSIVTATALIIATTIGGCNMLNNYEYSSGSRAGMINKISKKGFLWKTYEGQMALEGIVSSGESMGANVWDFSIDNQARHGENVNELSKKLNEALESGQKVKVNYIEVWGGWPWRGSTGHYVQSIEPIIKTKAEKQ